MLAELDQEWSARLVLHGDFPTGLIPESVLVAQDCPAASSWERQRQLVGKPAAMMRGGWSPFSLLNALATSCRKSSGAD